MYINGNFGIISKSKNSQDLPLTKLIEIILICSYKL